MKMYGGMETKRYAFLTSALDEGEWLASRPGYLNPAKNPGTHWIGGWVSPRADLDAVPMRKSPFPTPAGNRNPVIQPVA